MVPTHYYLILSAILFGLGVVAFIFRRNIITLFMAMLTPKRLEFHRREPARDWHMINVSSPNVPANAIGARQSARLTQINSTRHYRGERKLFSSVRGEQVGHVVGVLFFNREDRFEHDPRRRVLLTEERDQLSVVLDRDPLGDQVFLDHPDQIEFGGTVL